MIKYSVAVGESYVGIWLYSSSIDLGLAGSGYAESFADVSDWTAYAGLESFSSDGDVVTLKMTAEVENDVEGIERTGLNIPIDAETYVEFRDKSNSTIADYIQVRFYSGTDFYYLVPSDVVTWRTLKYNIKSVGTLSGSDFDTIDKIQILTKLDSGVGDFGYSMDYFRISPADEMGWQHDGSTVAGVTSSDGGTISTDGDNMTLSSDGDGSSFVFSIDTTTTASGISTTYYPFLNFEINSITPGDGWRLWQYDGSNWVAISEDEGYGWTTTTGTHRYNIQTLDDYVYDFRVNLTATCTLVSDLMKAYSIANYTYLQGAVSTNDFFYVDSGTLHCENDASAYMGLLLDPVISVSAPYDLWTIETSTGLGTEFSFRLYNGVWVDYNDEETSGDMPSGTTSDMALYAYDDCIISAITFRYIPQQWTIKATIIILFVTPIDEAVLDMFIVFLGMCMIPASTIYFVHGGKENMSMTKVFFFLVAFVIGWALLIGGIM